MGLVLYGSAPSPYVRKIRVQAHEAGIELELQMLQTSPIDSDVDLIQRNPLGKIPALQLADGSLLYDSRVISEYLESLKPGLYPTGADRWPALRLAALADGMLDAGVVVRYETFLRPEPYRWCDWVHAHCRKIKQALSQAEQDLMSFHSDVHIGTLSLACAIGWLEFRKPLEHAEVPVDLSQDYPRLWAWYQNFAQRPSMQATEPVA